MLYEAMEINLDATALNRLGAGGRGLIQRSLTSLDNTNIVEL